jgi:hypothetical protein
MGSFEGVGRGDGSCFGSGCANRAGRNEAGQSGTKALVDDPGLAIRL